MKPQILILNENQYDLPDNFEEVVQETLRIVKHNKEIQVNLIFVDEHEIIQLNENFRGYPEATDVLSFEAGYIDPETGNLSLGDIVICAPFVMKQSAKLGNKPNDEMRLMVIHGMLHLLGYDHGNEEEKSLMWETQKKILENLEIHLNTIPE